MSLGDPHIPDLPMGDLYVAHGMGPEIWSPQSLTQYLFLVCSLACCCVAAVLTATYLLTKML